MSTHTFLRASAITTLSTLTFVVSAASANAQSSRYGNVYDYESSRNCGQNCATQTATQSSRYGTASTSSCAPTGCGAPIMAPMAPVYTQPQPTTVYTAPTQYVAPTQTYNQNYTSSSQSYASAPANCPSGTTAQADGTCLQTGSYGGSYSNNTTTSTYSAPATTYAEPVNCPAGTTAQSDGTCMQSGSSGYSSYSSTSSSSNSYGSSSSYSSISSEPVNCPAGTTAQSDGTCMQGGGSNTYTNSTVEIYSGDAQSSQQPVYGYQSTGTTTSRDYMPIRK